RGDAGTGGVHPRQRKVRRRPCPADFSGAERLRAPEGRSRPGPARIGAPGGTVCSGSRGTHDDPHPEQYAGREQHHRGRTRHGIHRKNHPTPEPRSMTLPTLQVLRNTTLATLVAVLAACGGTETDTMVSAVQEAAGGQRGHDLPWLLDESQLSTDALSVTRDNCDTEPYAARSEERRVGAGCGHGGA